MAYGSLFNWGSIARLGPLVLALALLALPGGGAVAQDSDELQGELELFFSSDSPVAQIIRDHPAERAAAEQRLRTAFADDDANAGAAARAALGQELSSKYFNDYITKASDPAITAFLRAQTQSLEHLMRSGTDICYFWLFGGLAELGAVPNHTLEQQFRLTRTRNGIIGSAALQNDIRTLTEVEFQNLSRSVVQSMSEHYRPDHLFIQGVQDPTKATDAITRLNVCRTTWAYLVTILHLPDNQGATYYRQSLLQKKQ